MLALAILKKFWKEIALTVLIVGMGWAVGNAVDNWGEGKYRDGYNKREAEYAAADKKLREKHVKDIEEREVRNNELVTDLQKQLDDIASRPAGKPVWMCKQPASVSAPTGPAPDKHSPGAAEEAQTRPPGAVRDIGPGTRELLDEGDSAITELNALQEWATRECLRPPSTK